MKIRLAPRLFYSVLIILQLVVASALGQTRPVDSATRVAELFDNGQTAHERNDLEKAVLLYGEALKIDADFWQAEYQRATAWRSLRKYPEAQRGLLRTIELLAGFAEAEEGRVMLGRAWQTLFEMRMDLGQLEAAEIAIQQLLSLSQGRAVEMVRWQVGLAELQLRMGRGAAALSTVEAVRSAGDNRPGTMTIQGAALVMVGRGDEALKLFSEALQLDPGHIPARRQRAELLISRRDLTAAITDLREVQRLAPEPQTLQRLAWVLAQNGEAAESLKLYQQLLQLDPANSEAKLAVAALTIEVGQSDEAIKQLEELIKAEPARADLRARLAEMLIKNQPERALEQYLAAARIEPGQVSHRIGVGAVLVRLRRMAEAIGVLRTALDMNPPSAIAYYAHTNLGTALFEQNDFAGAIPEFLWILEHQTDERRIPITLYFLGICYDRIGEYEQALKVYEQFLTRATNVNQLEIDKVRLRLPIIQKQIRDGKGKRKK